MVLQWLNEISVTQRSVWTAVVAGGSLFCVFVLFVIDPLQTAVETLQADLLRLDQRLATAKTKEAGLIRVNTRIDALREEIETELQHIDAFRNLQEFRHTVSMVARRAGARVLSWKPDTGMPLSTFFRTVPVIIRIGGGYHDVARFLDALGEYGGIHRVESLTMHVAADGREEKPVLQTEVRLVGILVSKSETSTAQMARDAVDSPVMAGS
ncbi:MAG: hypothetical protein D6690_14835 [Nitrospirae bacterium]|nr:MAG: hypothetical protein D6690_14835 [Nitrospirota bacterium]